MLNFIMFSILYIMGATIHFKVLERKHIAIDKYWYEGDKDLIWAAGAIGLTIIWPLSSVILITIKVTNILLGVYFPDEVE